MKITKEHQELLNLVERYFDCSLSDSEEAELREKVANTKLSHPAIDEAKALMGFRQSRNSDVSQQRHIWLTFSAIAASICLLVSIAVHFTAGTHQQTNDVCVAYLNGERFTDANDVILLITKEMSEFDLSSDINDSNFENTISTMITDIDDYMSQPLL